MAKLRGPGPDVFHADEPIPLLARKDIQALKAIVDRTRFKRNRICIHQDAGDVLQEMFIVQSQATYVRPHRHFGKVESLLVLEGEADAVFFDDGGEITLVSRLGEYASGRDFFYRIGEGVYHTLLIRSDTFVFKEATLGPFDRSRTSFAPWSAEDGDADAIRAYMAGVDRRAREWQPQAR